MNNFDRVAPIYDRLVRLVFGNKLWQAQRIHLDKIKATDRVLILGGGTGRILEWMPDCEIDYLEKSGKMIELARRKGGANFINADFLNHDLDSTYDWVVCPFFLDCFNDEELDQCLVKIRHVLKKDGRMIVTDFRVSKPPQRMLVWTMLIFFRIVTRLSARSLPEFRVVLPSKGFSSLDQQDFLNGLVFSSVYKVADG